MGHANPNALATELAQRLGAQTAPHHLNVYDETPLNTKDIPQDRLDLANRTRSNVFPWRGQFSPELVEILLAHYAGTDHLILDPFAGVGTTLFEAARRSLPAVGVEINPAAFSMAGTALFIGRPYEERKDICEFAARLLRERSGSGMPLFPEGNAGSLSPADALVALVRSHKEDPRLSNIFTNTLIRLMESADPLDPEQALAAQRQHESVVMGLPLSPKRCEVFQADARATALGPATVDLVITSPPYINVFNYHQNCRRAMERMGWDLLGVARSEFGANRKHRGNRFLTVIQYCLDMAMALTEIKRVLKPTGRAIVVMGRESCVRGVSFRNGRLVGAVAVATGFRLVTRQERKFTNKFGDVIYEDILHLMIDPSKTGKVLCGEPRGLAVHFLEAALPCCAKADAASDVREAIAAAERVKPSPLFNSEDWIRP